MSLDNIKYSTNFLKEVIVRVDFASTVDSFGNTMPKRQHGKILKLFSIPEVKKTVAFDDISINLNAQQASTQVKRKFITEHHYYGSNREKQLVITADHFYILYKEYDIFETLKNDFINITSIIEEKELELKIKRVGLRYINIIAPRESSPLKWEHFINDKLLCILEFSPKKEQISRVFQVLDLNLNDYKLTFQFGMPNPDYPSPIVRKEFVLDLDAYIEGFIDDTNEVKKYIDLFHKSIQELFERSIKDGLREYMNEQR